MGISYGHFVGIYMIRRMSWRRTDAEVRGYVSYIAKSTEYCGMYKTITLHGCEEGNKMRSGYD